MNEKKPGRRYVDVYDLERRSVVKEDGCRYVPWVAIAEAQTALPQCCERCGAKMDGGDQDGEEA